MAQKAYNQSTSKPDSDRRPCASAKPKRSHSLAISPNLEALLEFEERQRGTSSSTASPTKVDHDLSPLSTPTTPTSLPPPPRGHRVSKALVAIKAEPNSPIVGVLEQRTWSGDTPARLISSSESNPYINPAPKLEDLLPPKLTNDGSAIGVDEGNGDDAVTVSGQFSPGWNNEATGRSPGLPRSLHFDEPNLATEGGRSFSKTTGLPWVFNAKFTTSHVVGQRTHKLAEFESRPDKRKMKGNPSSNLLDTKLNSHGKQKLEIKTDSGIISSSSIDSMSTFLNLSTPTTQGSPEADRHSFIDFVSPTLSDSGYNVLYTLNDDIRSTAGSSSPRAPPETAHRRIHQQGEMLDYQTSSAHSLDTNERAGLVKKSRKLARVFGETPEAGVLLHTFSETRPSTVLPLPTRWNRRHSLPLTIKAGDSEAPASRSPISFIDLSDEDDNISVITTTSKVGRRRRSIASLSLFENISPEEREEEERRRKRERLAKLHRFLGSRVPPSLVLGLEDPNTSLPPERPSTSPGIQDSQRKIWMRRRRSSSAAELPSSWFDECDRMKADLCTREKAINVKRAQKMEKVFGVAPPQTLYHTQRILALPIAGIIDSGPNFAKAESNWNRTAYTKHRSRKDARPSSTDSSMSLLPKDGDQQEHDTTWSPADPMRAKRSRVYTHYEHSLNSLHDILDRDDRGSLAELHHYLTGDDHSVTSPLFQVSPIKERRGSVTSSIKSDRRHSLPARASMTSISSEISFTIPKPDLTDFQVRRRRAAKLTNFFGVDYRVLIQDVLESIESGLEHERKRGRLAAEEAEDLLKKLRQLTLKRPNIY